MKISDKIIEYLKKYSDTRIKKYYVGDPLSIPASNLPAIIVEKRNTVIEQTATGLDGADKVYSIKLVFNKKDELGKNPEEVSSQRTMSDIIEGINETGGWTDNSIMGVLRKYFTLGDTINNQTIAIEYFTAQRGELIVEEAEITINIQDYVSVSVRT